LLVVQCLCAVHVNLFKHIIYDDLVFCYIIVNTFRSFVGNRQEVTFLKNLAIFLSVGNGLGRPFWGFLFDKFGFKPLFITLNVLIIIVSSSIYFVADYAIILAIYIPLCGVIQAGNFALMPAFVSKVFGLK
jgi:MFS family permease